jgi:hypothetical protein
MNILAVLADLPLPKRVTPKRLREKSAMSERYKNEKTRWPAGLFNYERRNSGTRSLFPDKAVN